MHALRKIWLAIFGRQLRKPPSRPPENAIVINRKDGSPYMWLWLDNESKVEPRISLMFAQPHLRGVKIMWSASVLPQMQAALDQLSARQK